jgi:hypothetical protein
VIQHVQSELRVDVVEGRRKVIHIGCDIHVYLELMFEEKWLYIGELQSKRQYDVFGRLAGVRSDEAPFVKIIERLPENASEGVKEQFSDWEGDAHSLSVITMEELEGFVQKFKEKSFFVKKWLKVCQQSIGAGAEDARVIIWFDN